MEALKRIVGYNSASDYRIRTAYIINSISMMLALLFIYFYAFYARYYAAVPGILLYFGSTVLVFGLLKRGYYRFSKALILTGFILQESAIVFILFSHDMHFNLFYFIVAPIAFFIFDFDNQRERMLTLVFSGLAIVMFTISEILPRSNYVIKSTPEITLLFNSISALSAILGISIVFVFFSKEITRAENELKHLANTDALTSIYNRRMFFETGEFQFGLAEKYQRKLSVILLDIDYFKNVNDQYGHPVGDEVLIQLADLIRGNVRRGDVFSRYGGEEFALLLKDADIEECVAVAEKIRKSVAQHAFMTHDNRTLNLTVSLGLACFNASCQRFDQLVLIADRNLYTAKEAGRNRWHVDTES